MADNWTINGQSLETYGVSVSTLSSRHLNAGSLSLQCVVDDYGADVPLNYGDTVILECDGVRIWHGRVTSLPRQAGGSDESISYEVADAWWYLENLVYRIETKRDESTSDTLSAGTLREATGQRIRDVLQYAIDAGAPFAIGDIDAGIPLWETGVEDTTCADVIRDLMRMSPRLTLFIDHASLPVPTFHLRKPEELREVAMNTVEGTRVISHSATPLYERQVPAVVITYSKPITIDGATHYQTTVDAAPEGATAATFGAMVAHIELRGSNMTYERAYIDTVERPDEGATDKATRRWWVDRVPELAQLAEMVGMQELINTMRIPYKGAPPIGQEQAPDEDGKGGIYSQRYSLALQRETLPPTNPESTPVPPANSAGELPRELVGGAIPDWLGRKQGQVLAKATLLLPAKAVDNLPTNQKEKKAALKERFKDKVLWMGVSAYAMQVTGSFMGTNAHRGHHLNLSAHDSGEAIPQGLAAALYEQTRRLRIEGNLSIIEEEEGMPSITVGDALRFIDSGPWQDALEPVQSISYDLAEMTLSIDYGPPNQLGVQDLLTLQRAKKRNNRTVRMIGSTQSDRERSIGGIQSTPNSQFTSQSEPKAEVTHPWQVTLSNDDEGGASVSVNHEESFLLKSPTSTQTETIVNVSSSLSVSGGEHIVLEIVPEDLLFHKVEFKAIKADSFSAVGDKDSKDMVTTRYTLAIVSDDGSSIARQFTRSQLALGVACHNGLPILWPMPL